MQSSAANLPSETASASAPLLHKVVCWDHIHMIHGALRIEATPSAIERFVKPLQRKLIQDIEYSHIEAYSPDGLAPDIFWGQAKEKEEYGPLGAYIQIGDILAAAEAVNLAATQEKSPAYRGGNMYAPLLAALKDSNAYNGAVGKSLQLFNSTPLRDPPPDGREKLQAFGPARPNFWPPSPWGFY